jgi:hypothetical protein
LAELNSDGWELQREDMAGDIEDHFGYRETRVKKWKL